MRNSIFTFCLLAALASSIFGQAQMRCEWVGNPGSTIVYSPWVVTDVGVFWDTKERTCCTTWSGPAIWYTVVKTSSTGVSAGAGVSLTGPSVSVGVSLGCSESIQNSTQAMGTATRKVKQTSCLFSSSEVVNQTLAFNATHSTDEGLVNEWLGATVTWDGQPLAYGDAIDMSTVGLGNHSYVVTRTDGAAVETYNFTITVVPSLDSEFLGSFEDFSAAQVSMMPAPLSGSTSMSTTTPTTPATQGTTAVVCFTNTSEFAVDVDFVPIALQAGIDVSIYENQVNIQPGDTEFRVVNFATQAGWVVPEGTPLKARVNVHAAGPFGPILASQDVIAATCFQVTGTNEDLLLESTVNNGNDKNLCAKPALAGDLLEVCFSSPDTTFAGAASTLLGDVFIPGAPLTGLLPAFPELHVSANYLTFVPFSPLPAAGVGVSFIVPPGLAGLAVRFQGVTVSTLAQNGLFAATDAHDIRLE